MIIPEYDNSFTLFDVFISCTAQLLASILALVSVFLDVALRCQDFWVLDEPHLSPFLHKFAKMIHVMSHRVNHCMGNWGSISHVIYLQLLPDH